MAHIMHTCRLVHVQLFCNWLLMGKLLQLCFPTFILKDTSTVVPDEDCGTDRGREATWLWI